MRVVVAVLLGLAASASACAPRHTSRSGALASLAVASDAAPAAGCACKSEAGDSCACAFTGSSCGDGAKYCHEVACKGKGCDDHCTKKICPTQNTQAAPGQCPGATRNCSERHCKGVAKECPG